MLKSLIYVYHNNFLTACPKVLPFAGFIGHGYHNCSGEFIGTFDIWSVIILL